MPFALYMLALAVFVMGTSEFMLAGLLPAIAADLDVPMGTAGLLSSAFALGMIGGAPLMAAFSRSWPRRVTLAVTLLLFAASHCVGAITTAFSLLLMSRVLSAVANAGFLAVALSASTAVVPEQQKGRALSVLLSGTTIATVAGVPAGALLGSLGGWRMTFWAIVVLCAPALYGVVRGVPGGIEQDPPPSDSPKLHTELRQLTDIRVILAMTLAALVNAGTFAVFTYLAPVVTDLAGLPEAWVSVTLVLFGVGSFIGVSMSGRLSDTRSGLVLCLGGPLLLMGWTVLGLVAADPVALMGMVLIQGVLSFGVGSTLIARVLYVASGAPTMAGAYATTALNMGAAAGPALGALALGSGFGLLGPVWVACGLTTAALIIVLSGGNLITKSSDDSVS